MEIWTRLMNLATIAILMSVATAISYNVGGPKGTWDMTSNLQAWATSQSFFPGDNLVFRYMPNHDVTEVTKADFDSCQVTNPLQTYTGGNAVIPLTSPGKRYFICGTMGHCSQGMKLEVDTLAMAAPPPSTTSAVLSPAPESAAQTPVIPLPLSPLQSPLGSPTPFPFIPSIESPIDSSPSLGSTLPLSSSATKVDKLVGTMVGSGFATVILLSLL